MSWASRFAAALRRLRASPKMAGAAGHHAAEFDLSVSMPRFAALAVGAEPNKSSGDAAQAANLLGSDFAIQAQRARWGRQHLLTGTQLSDR